MKQQKNNRVRSRLTTARIVSRSKKISSKSSTTAHSKSISSLKIRPSKSSEALKQLLLPRASNDYRPHLIRRYGLMAVLIVCLIMNGIYFWNLKQQILGDQDGITSNSLLSETNDARKTEKLPPLQLNAKLNLAAKNKAQDMIKRAYWSHDAPDGTTPWHFIDQTGYAYSFAGENLARGFSSANGIMQAWLKSPSHRANIMDTNYTEVGFAVVSGKMSGENMILVVAMYGKPASSLVANLSGLIGGGTVQATTKTGDTEATEGLTTRLERGISNLTPALIFSLILMTIVCFVSLLAHAYRSRLPSKLYKTWYRHHAVIKFGIAAFASLSFIMLYGGGVI